MRNVSDDTMHGSREEFFVLVIHRHNDEEFGTAGRVVMDLSEGEPIILEIVGIAGSG